MTDQNRFERMVADLQQQIDEQERAAYSAVVIQEASQPANVGRIEVPDARATYCGWCGDAMEIDLRIEGGQVVEARFVTDGCGPTVACGSMLTKMVQGKSLAEAKALTPEALIEALEGLPEDSLHCADLAVHTLREALAQLDGTRIVGSGGER